MNRLWKWLLHSDAKAPFLIALACFLVVCGWLGWQEFARMRAERAEAAAEADEAAKPREPAKLDPIESIGVLEYVEDQLASDTLIIPVNPFHPTFEALVLADGIDAKGKPLGREEWRERQRQREGREHGQGGGGGWRQQPPRDDWGDPRAPKQQPGGGQQQQQPQIKPKLSYNGFMQRPDGRYAPLFFDNTDKSNHFAASGGEIHGVKILAADKDGARVQMPDGSFRDLKLGDSVELPQN